MCYYNGQRVTREEFIRLKSLEKQVAKYDFLNKDVIDGFDFGKVGVLKPLPEVQDIELTTMEWGFIPDAMSWPFWETREQVNIGRRPHKDPRGQFMDGLNFLNAVGEELIQPRKVYRQAGLHRPCLILSSGYYEWRHIYPLNKRTGKPRVTAEKYPYRIYVEGQEYFYMAAVWQEWIDAETGEVVETVAMVTTEGNEVAREIHNSKKRQPTILPEQEAWEWLFGERTEANIKALANYQLPYEQMGYYPLAKNFLSAYEPLKKHYYPELPPLDIPGGDKSHEGIIVQTTLF